MKAAQHAPAPKPTAAWSKKGPSRAPAPGRPIGAAAGICPLLQAPLLVQRQCACGGTCPRCKDDEPVIRPKLKIGARDNQFEREADRVASEVIGGSAHTPASSPAAASRRGPVSRARDEDLTAGGSPLATPLRSFFEPRFGRDLSAVRLHTGPEASAWNERLRAHAFTYGSHVWLGNGRRPDADFLLAHELVHVLQQSPAPASLSADGPGPSRVSQRDAGGTVRRSAVEDFEPADEPGLEERQPVTGIEPPPPPPGGSGAMPPPSPEACPKPDEVPCPAASTSPGAVSNTFIFPQNSATLNPTQVTEVDAAAAAWHTAGGSVIVRVDGYASAEGECEYNWDLSCRRAKAVAAVLESPSDGSPGVLSTRLDVLAHGESDAEGAALARNRRATISIPSAPPPPPPAPAPTCPLPVRLGGARGCGGGDDFAHFDNPSISFSSHAKLSAWAAARPFSRGPFRSLVTDFECEKEMDFVLTALAGGAGHAAYSRFEAGTGGTETHGPGSMLGAMALASGSFGRTIRRVRREIEAQLAGQASSGVLDPCALSVTPPATHFRFSDGTPLKAVIGGTQGEELFATGFTGNIPLRTYSIDLRFVICDDFGVDESDLYAHGLFAFWVLQHERSASAYAPFINELDLPVTVSGTF